LNVRDHLLRELADGRFHSGQALAHALGVSRAAIWKQVRRLESDLGLSVEAVRGRGYRLPVPHEPLDAARILSEMGAVGQAQLDTLHILGSVDSTNTRAANDPPLDSGRARVWLAEHQTAGRGRRGRSWVSAFGDNLYLSLAWRFDLPIARLAGLSLVAGITVAEALQRLGLDTHGLKWPNDVVVDGRKLAGVLVEASGEAGGPTTAVIGVGINFHIPPAHGASIRQPWIDLRAAGASDISRNQLAGVLIDRMIEACSLFAAQRLAPFLPRWDAFDRMRGQPVVVLRGDTSIEGVYRGIAPSGAMLLENAEGTSEHHAGEVSLRPTGDR
jgi:BirA family biotin operon repressor/biotin-[acetyl-CoA-carboxylase] ligase